MKHRNTRLNRRSCLVSSEQSLLQLCIYVSARALPWTCAVEGGVVLTSQ